MSLKGGEFLIKETEAKDVFIPEEWNEEQLMIAQTCTDFLSQNVWNNLDRIDAQEEGLMVDLLNKAGELGLLGISVPEEFGGFGKDFTTSMLATEVLGAGHSLQLLFPHTQELERYQFYITEMQSKKQNTFLNCQVVNGKQHIV
jgi:alkylation response protein AidB-like acyl-CoA dehydrogenase